MASPLIEQMIDRHDYPVITHDTVDEFLQRGTTQVLFFTEDPKRYPESNDVAVVLPELERAFAGHFKPAVVGRDAEVDLKDRYDIKLWPTLVFLRDGRFLGKISKVRDWSDYMERIPNILNSEPRHNPGLGIPLVDESRGTAHA